MKALSGQARHVTAPSLVNHLHREVRPQHLRVVHRDGEGQGRRVVVDDEHRPLGVVPAWRGPEQVHEWELALHRSAKPDVVMVERVRPSVAVPQEAVGTHRILVGPSLAFHDRDRCDAQGRVGQRCRLEDPLRSHEGHTLAVDVEALSERGYGQDVATLVNLAPKPLERRQPHEPVTVGRIHDVVLHLEPMARCGWGTRGGTHWRRSGGKPRTTPVLRRRLVRGGGLAMPRQGRGRGLAQLGARWLRLRPRSTLSLVGRGGAHGPCAPVVPQGRPASGDLGHPAAALDGNPVAQAVTPRPWSDEALGSKEETRSSRSGARCMG